MLLVVVGAGIIIAWMRDSDKVETTKIRFAAATFTGIRMVFVLVVCLYFSEPHLSAETAATNSPSCCEPDSPGKEIFEKTVAGLFTLAGSIVGYLFGNSGSKRKRGVPPTDPRFLQLYELQQLFDAGTLKREEFDVEKKKILSS